MQFLILFFGLLATILWSFQVIFAFLEYRRQKKLVVPSDFIPSVSVIVPVFNEQISLLYRCIESLLRQNSCNIEIILVDDGSDIVYPDFSDKLVRHIRVSHGGKRHAQVAGFKLAKHPLIVTVDSDTILDKDAIRNLCYAKYITQSHAATGSIFLLNENQNILTKMIACMYWFSFFQERASQSFFRTNTCCSGALSVYDKAIIMDHIDDYINQTFFNVKCKAGDDRHLSNIFLLNNKKIVWVSSSRAYTLSPSTIMQFVKQQVRWTVSHIQSMDYIIRNYKNLSFMFSVFTFRLIFKHSYQIFLYVLMIQNFGTRCLLITSASILSVTFIKSLIAFIYTKDIKFVRMLAYTLYAFFILNPIILFGIFIPKQSLWRMSQKRIESKSKA